MRALLLLSLVGCQADSGKEHPEHAAPAPITNRLEVPAAVRQNLGITFAKAQDRRVAQTLRLAGHFTLPPAARRPHHTAFDGVVALEVEPLQRVERGALLATVNSPELLHERHELHLAEEGIGAAQDTLRVAREKVAEAQGALDDLAKRNVRLKKARSPRADLIAKEAEQARRLKVLKAEAAAARNAVTRARHRFDAELQALSAMLQVPLETVKEKWESIAVLELRAAISGVVSEIDVSPGTWVKAGDRVLELRDPGRLWLRARALNADLKHLREGQRVQVLPASRSDAQVEPVEGTLRIGASGDLPGQTVPVHVALEAVPSWARPGITATVEATIAGGQSELAIPSGALIRDGLQKVFFRRDPANPDKVIRVEADTGPSDGRWTVVFSGVVPGDEVVVEGAYELKLASSQKPSAKGHFHADGTWHAGEH